MSQNRQQQAVSPVYFPFSQLPATILNKQPTRSTNNAMLNTYSSQVSEIAGEASAPRVPKQQFPASASPMYAIQRLPGAPVRGTWQAQGIQTPDRLPGTSQRYPPQQQYKQQQQPYQLDNNRNRSRSGSDGRHFTPAVSMPGMQQDQRPQSAIEAYPQHYQNQQQQQRQLQQQQPQIRSQYNSSQYNSSQNVKQQQHQADDKQYLSQTMRSLADKAAELSRKHGLRDEVKLIEEEERKLQRYLQQEQERYRKNASPGPDVQGMNIRQSHQQQQAYGMQGKMKLQKQRYPGPDQNTTATASQSQFFEEPINELENNSDQHGFHNPMVNQSAGQHLNGTNFADEPMLEKFMRSQVLSNNSEMQLDRAVNRLFEDASRKKMKIERMRLEGMLSELSATRITPSINANSQHLARDRRGPMHTRTTMRQQYKNQRENSMLRDLQEKQDLEEAELTFKPQINEASRTRALSNKSRSGIDFLEREKLFLAQKEAKRAKQVQQKQKDNSTELTFQPMKLSKPQKTATTTPKKVTEQHAQNFWERNMKFMEKKSAKIEQLDRRWNKDLTFQPKILPKSRDMSQSSDRSRSSIRPWAASRIGHSQSKDTITGIQSARGLGKGTLNRDLASVKGFSKFTRPESRNQDRPKTTTQNISNSTSKLDLKNQQAIKQQRVEYLRTQGDQNRKINNGGIYNGDQFNMTMMSESIGVSATPEPYSQQTQNAFVDSSAVFAEHSQQQINQFEMTANQSFSQFQGAPSGNRAVMPSISYEYVDQKPQQNAQKPRQRQQQYKQKLNTKQKGKRDLLISQVQSTAQSQKHVSNPPTVNALHANTSFTFINNSPPDMTSSYQPKSARFTGTRSSQQTLESKVVSNTKQKQVQSNSRQSQSKSPNNFHSVTSKGSSASLNFSKRMRGGQVKKAGLAAAKVPSRPTTSQGSSRYESQVFAYN